MPAKKGSKSNKTAHVLNVLSGHPSENESSSGEPAAASAAGIDDSARQSPQRPLLPPVLEVARADDDALSQKIQDALTQEFEGDLQPVSSPANVSEEPEETVVSSSVSSFSEPDPLPATPQDAPPPPEVPKEKSPAPESQNGTPFVEASQSLPEIHSTAALPDDLVYVNVMQALVEEKAKKYIDMFGLCSCSRCMADVKALALTNLPSKYMVMHKGEFIPMLTVYENQFGTALTAQIIAACKIVMEHPRHG